MLMPNKVISVKESSIYKSCIILEKLTANVKVDDLFELTNSEFNDVTDFLDALVLLFSLKRIDFDYVNGEVFRVN